ncbi:hypothetical protein [Acaryochloris sp. IP29b_bin.137]|uniref:hypothetical protein n=1 Tax=Acaryochloris sp. IP29b_bin.137 TaxID=2969217 RepID=UPI0026322114|nr:hypothetical protein [Acaryochloris sp. IP29b_bin.137]
MYSHTQSPTSDRILGASLAAFSILAVGFSAFVVGYTLTRTSLQENTTNANAVHDDVIPHQATLWQPVGE